MATLTFPPTHIEQALADPAIYYHRRVDIYEPDTTTIWRRGAPLVGGSISIDQRGTDRRSGSITLEGLTVDRIDGFWYDKVIKIYMGITTSTGTWEQAIGTFLMSQMGSEDYIPLAPVSLRDFSSKLDYDIPLDVGWPSNHPIEDIIGDLALGGGILPGNMNLPVTGDSVPEEKFIRADSNRWRSMVEVAEAYNYDLYFDADGVLQMQTFADPFLDPPQFRFRVGLGSNVASIGRNIKPDLIRNHVVVAGEAPDGSPVWGEAFNNEPLSPTRIDRLGQRTRRVENSWVQTFDQATELAERILRFESLEQVESNLGTIIVPWLDVNVTVEFVDPNNTVGDPTRFLLNRVEIPLDLSPAKSRLARVTNVIALDALYPEITLFPDDTIWPGAP